MAEVGAQTQRKETATPAGPLRSQREEERFKETSPGGAGKWSEQGGGRWKVRDTKFLLIPSFKTHTQAWHIALSHRVKESDDIPEHGNPSAQSTHLHTFPHPAADPDPVTAEPQQRTKFRGRGPGSASWVAAPSPHSHMVAHWLNISEGGLS